MAHRLHLTCLLVCIAATAGADTSRATAFVAASTADDATKAAAAYACDGDGDQEEINRAICELPPEGGTVLLSQGTFDIRRVEGTLGGVLIERSDVVLAGQGAATRLVQGPGQETNVIRIIGNGVGRITIRDLYVDANRDANPVGEGDPDVSHARFEFCGIKAFRTVPGGPSGDDTHDITVQHCWVVNARRLGIMLEGPNMRVLDNVFGNAGSDVVEILTGPGIIRGNYIEITGQTHVAVGSDRANNIIMAQNIVHVTPTGQLDIGFRSWAQSRRHVIADNVLTVDPGGQCGAAMEIRGIGASVTGNAIHSANDQPLPLRITGGNTLVTNNIMENVAIVVDDAGEENYPIVVKDNIMEGSRIEHIRGNLNPAQQSP
jgi:hypothetical protein